MSINAVELANLIIFHHFGRCDYGYSISACVVSVFAIKRWVF